MPWGAEIAEPIGIVQSYGSSLMVVSHTTSKIYVWQPLPETNRGSFLPRAIDPRGEWKSFYSAPEDDGQRYGFRCLASDGDTLFFSDETEGAVWMMSAGGKVARFASGLGDPSGLAFGRDRALYVSDESNGGRLLRLDDNGKATVVAAELGRPRAIVFTDDKTALVANRDGNVWKVVLP